MTLNGIISTSLSGLFTNQAALQATSNNIANVNTEGYSRVRVITEANTLQGQTAGVAISEIERVVDEFLSTALRTSQSNTAEFSTQREFHDRLQGILGDPASNSSLSARVDQLFSSVADLALNPADVLRRQQMLSEMKSLLDQMNLYQEQIQNLRGEASSQVAETVTEINTELQRIFELNPLLVQAEASGGETSGLEGQLGQALNNLSELIDIKVNRNADGSVNVTTSSGYPLVDEGLLQLEYDAPGIVDATTNFPTIDISRVDPITLEPSSTSVDLTSNIRSGKIAGLLEMRDEQLVDLSVSLGELAARTMDEFNAIQNQYSSVPAPNTMTGKQTFVDGGHSTGFSGIVTFAVVDASNQLVSSTTVDFDSAPPADFNALVSQVNTALGGAGTLSLTNGVMSFSAASSTNGVVIAQDETAPSNRGGRGFSHFFGMNDLMTARESGVFETGVVSTDAHNMGAAEAMSFRVTDTTGRELASVSVTVGTTTSFDDIVTELNSVSGLGAYFNFSFDSDGQLTWTNNSGFEGAKLDLLADNTDLGGTGVSFSKAFGLDEQFRVNAASEIEINEAIVSDPNLLGLSVFDVTGGVGDVVLTDGDQRGALAFQNLETQLVDFDEAGDLKQSQVTLSQYVARFLGNAGLKAEQAQNQERDNQSLQDELFQRNADVSGVNMDEELANLIVYQNAYGAAARVLSSVQEMYDTLLGAV